jgi:hypothetical protein
VTNRFNEGAEALLNKVSGAMDAPLERSPGSGSGYHSLEFDIDDHFTSSSPMNNPMSLISSLFSDPDKSGKIVQSIGSFSSIQNEQGTSIQNR